jgi:hypothetical protein
MSETPDLVEEIVGWRAWRVIELLRGGAPILISMYGYDEIDGGTTYWPGHAWLHANCIHAENPPCERGRCGIYAARSRQHLLSQGYQSEDSYEPIVIGEVGLAGRVRRCTRGYRAARARPVSLLVPYENWRLVAGLRERYRVPVTLADTLSIEEALGWT